jgi:hypothetical protein
MQRRKEEVGERKRLLIDLGDHLTRLGEEDACRPATNVLDAVCVA